MRKRVLLLAALTFACVPLLGVSPAYACTCAEADDREYYERAEVVFKGTLTAPTHAGVPDGVVTFAVSRVYKGAVTSTQEVETGINDGSCGMGLQGPGPFLVFAKGGAALEADLCSGTREIGSADKPKFGGGVPVALTGDATVARAPDWNGPWSTALPVVYFAGGAGLLALLIRFRRGRRPGAAQHGDTP